ncbi:MAG: hypothetical protein WAW96_15285 [Alphaproteobacteria bacterium]
MLAKEAKRAARDWVLSEAAKLPGFAGAYLSGSILQHGDEETFPPSSDVDITIVVSGASPAKLGKFIHNGVLLEAGFASADRLATPEQVLRDYHLAPSFRAPVILADPSGKLGELGDAVSREFLKRRWVLARCAHAREHALNNLRKAGEGALEDRVFSVLFGAGIACHVLLVAGLKNPTVRQRYVATRELLNGQGCIAFHEELLETLGCAGWNAAQTEAHLAALEAAFDATKTAMKTAFFYSSDLSDAARPIAIDGSRELIHRGLHREAVFWIEVTFTRCQKVLSADAPGLHAQFMPGYAHLLGDLGIDTPECLQRRADEAARQMPRVWEMAQAMIAGNPQIID